MRGHRTTVSASLPPTLEDAILSTSWAASRCELERRSSVAVAVDRQTLLPAVAADLREWIDVLVAVGATDVLPLTGRQQESWSRNADLWQGGAQALVAYARRLCWAMRLGRSAARIAVHCDGDDPAHESPVTKALVIGLLRLGIAVRVLPRSTMTRGRVSKGALRIGAASYHTIVVPPNSDLAAQSDSYSMLRRFSNAGGLVLDLGDEQPDRLMSLQDGWRKLGGGRDASAMVSILQSQLRSTLALGPIVTPSLPGGVLVARRLLDDGSLLWIVNRGDRPRSIEVSAGRDIGTIEKWNPESGETERLPSLFGDVRPQVEAGAGLLLRMIRCEATVSTRGSWFGHGPGQRTWLDLSGTWQVRTNRLNVGVLGLALASGATPSIPETGVWRMPFRVEKGMRDLTATLLYLGAAEPVAASIDGTALHSWKLAFVEGMQGWATNLEALSPGSHTVDLVVEPNDGSESRKVALLRGEFSAAHEPEMLVVSTPPAETALADFQGAGLPDYAGAVEWRKRVVIGPRRPLVMDIAEQASGLRTSVGIEIDGVDISSRWWPPYEIDISDKVPRTTADVRVTIAAPAPSWQRYMAGLDPEFAYTGGDVNARTPSRFPGEGPIAQR